MACVDKVLVFLQGPLRQAWGYNLICPVLALPKELLHLHSTRHLQGPAACCNGFISLCTQGLSQILPKSLCLPPAEICIHN